MKIRAHTIVFDDSILPDSFAEMVSEVRTLAYVCEGTERFLAGYGPAQYRSAAECARATRSPLPATIIGGADAAQATIESVIDVPAVVIPGGFYPDGLPFTKRPVAECSMKDALDVMRSPSAAS